MLEKFLNKKVSMMITSYTYRLIKKGIITKIDDDFIELDNNEVIAIKYIMTIKFR